MRKIFILLLLCCSTAVFSQQDTGISNRTLKRQLLSDDTALAKLRQLQDSVTKSLELKQWEERNTKAMLAISEQISKNKEKQKRNAYLRIGIGVAFLIVLIVGLMRRRAKK